MQNLNVKKGMAFVIIMLFVSLTLAPSIIADTDTSTESNQKNYSRELTEEEFHELRYIDIPISYRYMTEDGQIHTVIKSRSELLVKHAQYFKKENTQIISTYTDEGNHPPIYINGNENFTIENGVSSGSGTFEDPYLICDWIIAGNGMNCDGIFIENTNVFFMIRNCNISGFSEAFYAGIRLTNVENCEIENVDSYENYHGIVIYDCKNITINNSKFHDTTGWGADSIGILIEDSSYNFIEDTYCYNNYYGGIDIITFHKEKKCVYNTIKNCVVFNNTASGISLGAVDLSRHKAYDHVIGCKVYNNGHWPDADNADYGIVISNIDNNIIEDCDVHHNGQGIYICVSSNNVIRNCSVHDQYQPVFLGEGITFTGMYLRLRYFSINNTVEHCNIYDQDAGIICSETLKLFINKNNIYHNNITGMEFGAFNLLNTIRIINNNIYDNGWGYENESGWGLYALRSIIDGRHNWWGADNGPEYRFHKGHGESIWSLFNIIIFRPWAKEPFPDAGLQ